MKGLLITLEGHEGSGKTTQSRLLVDNLNAQGIESILVREPGNTKIGEEIKEVVSKVRTDEIVYPETELFLFQASRAQLVRTIIQPALQQGLVVVADRFIDSSWVYQGFARGLNILAVEFTNRAATAGIKIDKTFMLKLPLEVSMERIKSRTSTDRIEAEGIEFYKRVYVGYDEVAKVYKDRIQVVDATKNINEIQTELINKVKELIMDKKNFVTDKDIVDVSDKEKERIRAFIKETEGKENKSKESKVPLFKNTD